MIKHPSSPWFHQDALTLVGLIRFIYLFIYLLNTTAIRSWYALYDESACLSVIVGYEYSMLVF
jgi:hypothetical protein